MIKNTASIKIRRTGVLLLLICLYLLRATLPTLAYNGDIIVYVTDTGECYHREGCTYLKSERPITLERADRMYRPCSRCDPPRLGEDSSNDTDRYYSYEERQEMEREAKLEEERQEKLIAEEERIRREQEKKQQEEEREAKKAREKENTKTVIQVVTPIIIITLITFVARGAMCKKQARREHEARCKGELPGGMPGMPFGTIIGDDGMPREIDAKFGWGKKYTFFVSRTGYSFHRAGCTRNAYIMVHAASIGNRKPCKKCRPVLPNLSWFKENKKTNGQITQNDEDIEIYEPKCLEEKMDYWLDVEIRGQTTRVYANNPQELADKIERLKEKDK